jgi:hypothetical protein
MSWTGGGRRWLLGWLNERWQDGLRGGVIYFFFNDTTAASIRGRRGIERFVSSALVHGLLVAENWWSFVCARASGSSDDGEMRVHRGNLWMC